MNTSSSGWSGKGVWNFPQFNCWTFLCQISPTGLYKWEALCVKFNKTDDLKWRIDHLLRRSLQMFQWGVETNGMQMRHTVANGVHTERQQKQKCKFLHQTEGSLETLVFHRLHSTTSLTTAPSHPPAVETSNLTTLINFHSFSFSQRFSYLLIQNSEACKPDYSLTVGMHTHTLTSLLYDIQKRNNLVNWVLVPGNDIHQMVVPEPIVTNHEVRVNTQHWHNT
jgi:hypothetical protein